MPDRPLIHGRCDPNLFLIPFAALARDPNAGSAGRGDLLGPRPTDGLNRRARLLRDRSVNNSTIPVLSGHQIAGRRTGGAEIDQPAVGFTDRTGRLELIEGAEPLRKPGADTPRLPSRRPADEVFKASSQRTFGASANGGRKSPCNSTESAGSCARADAPKPNASASSKIRDGADGIRWKPNRRGPSVNGSPRGLRHRDGG